ncbi:NUDIX hydrolase [Marinobacter halodurans]|uniref:NUDIX hydrolase n=1 Tax=Marinobacter halodurans TaxID=2528979 RepID=A0ABY1ZNU6_9GAMM|nr:NUDIX hydrolase [Marinobacter halodurans]TBW55449.1 NUDIX hydrolase [Marinobacter halodurans]
MIVTLDFVCLRLNRETRAPEVMLQKRQKSPELGRDALVGGWVWERPEKEGGPCDVTLDDAVARILSQKVGLQPSYLERVKPEGGLNRDPSLGWSVTLPHLCLFNRADNEALQTRPGIRWVSAESILSGEFPLPYDHGKLVASAYEVFLNKIKYSSLLLYLLPEQVAIAEIVEAYAVLGIRVSKQTVFSRWVNAGLLIETGERRESGSRGRAPMLYRLTERSLSYFDSEIGKSYKTRT